MGDYKAVSRETNKPPLHSLQLCRGREVGLVHDERLTIHDLSSLKQRFAQLTTFKCHPTAKSAYQHQGLHRNEDVCRGNHFSPLSHPNATK